MRFSRSASEITGSTNSLYRLRDELVSQGKEIADLIAGNVTEHWQFPRDVLGDILQSACAATTRYRPDPRGRQSARIAIADYYDNPRISADNIILTPGTSVSFQYCFQLLADRGDEILCPKPSYPLFDVIANLCGIEMRTYDLIEEKNWQIDLDGLEQNINPKTRAIVLISPHNPTGMVASAHQIEALARIAAECDLPIISDEVFCEFLYTDQRFARVADTIAPLVLTLNGFSKMFGLPGLKLGWIAVSGDPSHVANAMQALEMISDTFLSVSDFAQFCVADIFQLAKQFQREYVQGITDCRQAALRALHGLPLVPAAGGFYLALPISCDEDEAAEYLLRKHHILVHPGYFYDMDGRYLVMTFVCDPARVHDHFQCIAEYVRSKSG